MSEHEISASTEPAGQSSRPASPPTIVTFPRSGLMLFAAWLLILLGCFAVPLVQLANYARGSDLYSHILLIPFVSGYLIWLKRDRLKGPRRAAPVLAVVPFVFGIGLTVGYWLGSRSGWKPSEGDYFAMMTWAFLLLLYAGALVLLGPDLLRPIMFPVAFLAFMAPFPDFVLDAISGFLQYRSADTAYAMLRLSGMPVLREENVFTLPGFQMEVAPQCSGIHSTLVLLITSCVASYLFLQSPWRRGLLVFAVVPLALLRNGFRIFTIGQLCVHVSPDMIESPIHKRGGPIFFALSLIPFFLLLWYLRRGERSREPGRQDSVGDHSPARKTSVAP